MSKPTTTQQFNITSESLREKGSRFYNYMESHFGPETALEVVKTFKKLRLPVPKEEFLGGTEGALVFLNRYGMVLRVEARDGETEYKESKRVDDSTWVLRPVASINAGKAVIELCPGCKMNSEYSDAVKVRDNLRKEGIDFWDMGDFGDATRNVGMIPYKMRGFPKGVPVVIDRLAVGRLSQSLVKVARSLNAQDPQELMYGSLKRMFTAVWSENPDPAEMSRFWEKCLESKKHGKLVAGWNEYYGDSDKSREAPKIAAAYESLFTRKFSKAPAFKKT